MQKFIAPTLALGLALSAGIFFAPEASAKGHNQGVNSATSTSPGTNVGSETVSNSHTEGTEQGNRPADKGPSADNPAVERADGGGSSGNGPAGPGR